MPPGKDRDNAHISMPTEMKEQLMAEAARRSMSVSDLVCEYIQRGKRQDEQWRLDLQRILEVMSQKMDTLLVQTAEPRRREPKIPDAPAPMPWLDGEKLEAWEAFLVAWEAKTVNGPAVESSVKRRWRPWT